MASKAFEQIIPIEDRYEVAKARLELHVTRTHLVRFLDGFITRIMAATDASS